MSHIDKIVNWMEDLFVSKDSENNTRYGKVVSIVYGKKVTNGIKSDEYSIRIFVDKKKPLDQIPVDQIIPKFINFDGVEVKTDVDDNPIKVEFLTDCFGDPEEYNPPEPISTNRKKHRPLKGGSSSIYIGGSDATLGILVRDKTDGSIVALSNNHVYANLQLAADEVDPFYGDQYNVESLSARQPGTLGNNPYGSANPLNDLIGIPKRYIPFSLVYPVFVDACIVSLTGNDLIDSSSAGIINFSAQPPFKWASSSEINSLLDPTSHNYGAPLFKSGRTTGPVGVPGSLSACDFSCTGSNCYTLCATNFTNLFIGYPTGGAVYFASVVGYKSAYRNFVPSRGGDSGSAVFALLSANLPALSTWKFVGLNFAGDSVPGNSSSGYFCRAPFIESQLNVMAWDTLMPELCSKKSIIAYRTKDYPTSSIISLSGRSFSVKGVASPPPVTPTPTPTVTPTTSLTPTITPTETVTPTITPTETVTPTITPTETVTPTITPTETKTPTPTPTETVTPTITPTITPTMFVYDVNDEAKNYVTPTITPTITPSETETPTPTPTETVTPTITPSETETPTPTPTETVTPTITPSETETPTPTPTETVTITPTETETPTPTPTPPDESPTPTPTITDTPTSTPTETVTPTITPSETETPTPTPTETVTPTVTPSITVTITPTQTLQPAVLADDNVYNSPYNGSSFSNGNNGGTGFNAWDFNSSGSAGTYAYSSQADGFGNIDTGSPGRAFGLYASSGSNNINVRRNINNDLTTGYAFSAAFVIGYTGGYKGFSLYSGTSWSTELCYFYSNAGNYYLNSGTGLGWSTATNEVFTVVAKQTTSSNLQVTVTKGGSSSTVNVTGTLRGFRFFNSGGGGVSLDNMMFNSMKVYKY